MLHVRSNSKTRGAKQVNDKSDTHHAPLSTSVALVSNCPLTRYRQIRLPYETCRETSKMQRRACRASTTKQKRSTIPFLVNNTVVNVSRRAGNRFPLHNRCIASLVQPEKIYYRSCFPRCAPALRRSSAIGRHHSHTLGPRTCMRLSLVPLQ
jgi:hypothetical protein